MGKRQKIVKIEAKIADRKETTVASNTDPGEHSGKMPRWFVFVGGFIGILTLVNLIWVMINDIYQEYREYNPRYSYETRSDWLWMDEAASFLSDQSVVEVYKTPSEENVFYSGAALTVLYNNLDEQERVITRFTVYADDIVEDYSPNLISVVSGEIDPISFILYNQGWGETGEMQIGVLDLAPAEGYEAQDAVMLSVRESAVTSWTATSLKPGAQCEIDLLSEEDFKVEYKKSFDDMILYRLRFKVVASESNYEAVIECLIEVHPDKIQLYWDGIGGPEPTCYVVWTETSSNTWTKTYTVDQRLPGKQAVRLPIFIVPEMSCTMSIRIEFETLDGEIITAKALEHAKFIIPYYEDPHSYIDGELLDWDNIDGDTIVYFPFKITSTVIPKEE